MALYKLLCGVALVVLLTSDGCHSSKPACGTLKEGRDDDEPYPWQAYVTLHGARQCLATLISNEWLLTDGRCGYGPDDYAEVVLASDDDEEPYKVELYKCSHTTPETDGLCLLKLNKTLKYSDDVSPICLAAKGSKIYTGTKSYVSTGSCDEPTEDVRIVGYNECKCYRPSLTKSQICAGKGEEKADPVNCQKTIGGALMHNSHGFWALIGVSPYQHQCLTPESLKTYTRVSYSQDWIEEVTGSSPAQFTKCQPKGVDSDEQFVCPDKCDKPPKPKCDSGCDDLSIFDAGLNMMPSFPLVLLCVLALSLFATRW